MATHTSPMCLSALYFMNLRGDVLMERQYRDDVTRNMAQAFRTEVIQGKDRGNVPIVNIGACSFMYRREKNVYLVAVTRANANAMLCFQFLNELVALFTSYFSSFTEDAIRSNFVIIYELLDEILDHGFPQITSPDVLKSYITQTGVQSKEKGSYGAAEKAKQVSMQVTGAVQWRREGLKYKKNEVYLDIIESVSLLMSPKGTVLRASATGVIAMKCFLTGMPELKIGLNDKLGEEAHGGTGGGGAGGGGLGATTSGKKSIELADLQFHQCVNLSKFNGEKTISFTPPDGEFELMKYRVTEGISLPFKVMPIVKELGRTRMEVNVRIRSCFSDKQFAMGVVMRIPVPKHTAKATIKVTGGKAKYVASQEALVWKIKRFQGLNELTLSAEVELVSTLTDRKAWNKPPITLDFQVPMFTASGLRIRFLKVWEKTGYISTKWVRYLCNSGKDTKTGHYEIRCQ
mmetsp:Transcript_37470/g.93140  ORF Transcript_37470/g.93140 Transcript_37470/m.93140 type:complete len:460 (-) Transcript_37470:144-1523(-)|eukprot:CAMPEP_0181360692 /NCGR_PEP_ID=MMETSP1106-20121128/6813_1 /TAXON_ID=81844 /ORGANISM="Mantoniella antarctica, Strain SL-175" /LENGTH=459 /DNA_ID=CAMNT_0023474005 /DNA_START=261 /DNA_END=1640 /DNA_ORIENTATION=+